MNDTDLKDEKYEAAVTALDELTVFETKRRNHLKIMHCLPEHKQKKHNFIYSQILKKRYNLFSKYGEAIKKLNNMQLATFRSEESYRLPV